MDLDHLKFLKAYAPSLNRFNKLVDETLQNWPERSVELLSREWRTISECNKNEFVLAIIARLCLEYERGKLNVKKVKELVS